MRALLLATALHLACYLPSHAQLHLPQSTALFAQGLALFQKEKYESAQHHFEAYIRAHKSDLNAIDAQYYAALCAIKLGRPDGEERFHRFIKTYPEHCKAVLAYYQLGNLYFGHQDFAKSITYYLQVEKNTLDKATQHELQYRLAYAYLNEKDFVQALAHFNDIKAHESAYCYAANYYAGYLAFKNDDYATALEDLLKASESAAYQPVVPYLVLQVYYKQKRFQELINYIQAVMHTEVALKNEDEIALLTAEAYFFTDQYAAAAHHYEEYLARKDLVATSEVLYRTAHALYKADEGYKALKYFKKLALQQDAIGQAASYYAGLLYLKTHQKMLALAAFDKAQQTNFSPDIREEAILQYAQLSYELGHFASTIEALQKFKKDYTASPHLAEADAWLSEAYLRTNDYDLAITHIEGLNTQPQRILKVYQKVTFYKGSEYFNNAAYAQAIGLFQKSLQYPYEKNLVLQAQLWLGESHSAMQQYDPAVAAYQYVLANCAKTTTVYQQALYGLGYAYFNTACYAQALPQFVQYMRQPQPSSPPLWFEDALVRSADCYYATKEYQRALQVYDQALQHHPAHAHYQKGVIYGRLHDKDAAQKNFQRIFDHYANTVYYEKALFEMAHIDFVQGNYPQAIKAFTKLAQEKPHSMLIPDALLSRAIAHVNLAQYPQAIQDYECLLKTYPQHPNTQNALLELPRIYMLAGKPEAFHQRLTDYQAANPDNANLEQLEFDTAKGLFYDQSYAAAIKRLSGFIARYPQSSLVPEAHFLVAEAYYRQGDVPQAMVQYQDALKAGQTPFYNKILLRMGSLAYKQKDFTQALQYYQQLKEGAKSKKETYHALEGIMKVSHALQRYEAVQQSAFLILEQGNLAVNATNEATLFLGKAAMQQGKRYEAQAYFTQLVQSTTDSTAAEAQYLLAQLHYEAQAYHQSLAALFELNKRFPAYKAWTNQGYLLMANNYLALQEVLQAQATLQSIIDNAEDKALVATARQKLATLEIPQGPVQLTDTEEATSVTDHEFKTLED